MVYGLGHGWFMGFGWFFGVIFIVLIVWLVVRNVNQGGHRYYPPQKNTALDILKERYARGEISKEEFEEKKKDIM